LLNDDECLAPSDSWNNLWNALYSEGVLDTPGYLTKIKRLAENGM